MPEMSGSEFLIAAKREAAELLFVFLSGNDDLEKAVDLLTKGAADYIRKQIIAETLLFRVEKAVEAARQAKLIERIEQERQLLELENRKLVNWRNLYASKDARQTDQMIRLLSRTINQAGGFMWLDLLVRGAGAGRRLRRRGAQGGREKPRKRGAHPRRGGATIRGNRGGRELSKENTLGAHGKCDQVLAGGKPDILFCGRRAG